LHEGSLEKGIDLRASKSAGPRDDLLGKSAEPVSAGKKPIARVFKDNAKGSDVDC